MSGFLHHFTLASPLFLLVLLGYALARSGRWPEAVGETLGRFAYAVAMPAMLFRMMSDFARLPPVDLRLLLAFFGGCLIVFVIGRLVARSLFRLDGVAQSVFALGGVFSNNVMLGIAIAKTTLGPAALPAVSLVIVFNALILWTLVTVSVEWARHGEFSVRGFGKTARGVLTNPIVASILAGTLWGFAGIPLPRFMNVPLEMLGQGAVPFSLVALAMGVNVYMMAQQFRSLQGPIAAGMVLSTLLSALTTPLVLTLSAAGGA